MEGKRKNADKETKKYKKEKIIFSKNVAEKSFWGLTSRTFFPAKFIPTGLLNLVYIIKGPMKQQNAYQANTRVCLSFHFRREKRPRLNDVMMYFKCGIWN